MCTASWLVGSEVCKRNMVILDNQGGSIVPAGSNAAKRIQKFVDQVLKEEGGKSTKLRIEKGVYVFDYGVDEDTHKAEVGKEVGKLTAGLAVSPLEEDGRKRE